MTLKKRAQVACEFLLSSVLEFYKDNQNLYCGAQAINKKLGIEKNNNNWIVHGLLKELERRGHLKQKKNKGFTYNKKSAHTPAA